MFLLTSKVEGGDGRSVKVVCFPRSCRCRELPELVIVVLDPDEGGDHGEGPVEGSVRPGGDQQLVGQGGAIAGPGDVDIVHVRGGDLVSNLGDQVKDELDIISLALLSVHIP